VLTGADCRAWAVSPPTEKLATYTEFGENHHLLQSEAQAPHGPSRPTTSISSVPTPEAVIVLGTSEISILPAGGSATGPTSASPSPGKMTMRVIVAAWAPDGAVRPSCVPLEGADEAAGGADVNTTALLAFCDCGLAVAEPSAVGETALVGFIGKVFVEPLWEVVIATTAAIIAAATVAAAPILAAVMVGSRREPSGFGGGIPATYKCYMIIGLPTPPMGRVSLLLVSGIPRCPDALRAFSRDPFGCSCFTERSETL